VLHNCSDQTIEESGFSTLEAVIAVGILALCVLPLMDFQQTVAEGAGRLSRSNDLIAAKEQVESFLRALPSERIADGHAAFGATNIVWREVARSEAKPALSESGAPGRFQIALVVLDYQVQEAGSIIGTGSVDRLVWTSISPFLDEEFEGKS